MGVKAAANFKGTLNFLANSTGVTASLDRKRPFQELVMRDNIDFLGAGDDARIARIDAIDIGVDFSIFISLKSGGDRNGGQVAAAAAKGGDLTLKSLALETCNDADEPVGEVSADLARGDVGDFGFRMEAVGQNPRLGAMARPPLRQSHEEPWR